MYICICNSVTHYEIEDAVECGHVSSLSCLRRNLRVGHGCGICLDDAKRCLDDALRRNLVNNSVKRSPPEELGGDARQHQGFSS